MKALVVYESMFGNTAAVARAVAAGISVHMPVDVVCVASAPTDLDGYALVVVGGPTHAFGMTRPATRRAAVEQGAGGGTERGVREWLDGLARLRAPVPAAAFDTRIRIRGVPGSAARSMRRRLRRLGADTSAGAMSFWVTGTPGPLADGERERAERWGATLGAARPAPVTSG